jgi:hypothetical protein
MFRGVIRYLLRIITMSGEITINGSKFAWGLRDILQLVVLFLALVGLYFGMSARLNTADKERIDLYGKYAECQRQWTDMDKAGTHRSHEIDAMQQQQINNNIEQINLIHTKLNDLVPKVDKIDQNVLWLMGKQLEYWKQLEGRK